MDNKPISNEELLAINFEKAVPKNYLSRHNRIQVVTEDGKVYLADASPTRVRAALASDMQNKKISNPKTREMGKNLEYNFAPVYESYYAVGSGVKYGHPGLQDNPPIIIGNNEYGIMRTNDDKFVFVNKATGKSEAMEVRKGLTKKNFEFGELESILNKLLQ
jgi:hypothetical protein